MNWITSASGGVVVNVRVVPRASKNQIQGLHGDALKVRLQAPPVEGKANAALLDFLREALDLPARDLALLTGATGRNKRVFVRGLSPQDAEKKLLLPG